MLGANDPQARYGRVGHNLMCVCGCGQILVECNHVGCPDSARMTGELKQQLGLPGGIGSVDSSGGSVPGPGGSDSTILKWFADKYGAVVLAAPIRGGFDNLAWILPFGIFLVAIFGTAIVVRTWARNRRQLSPAGVPNLPHAPDNLRDRIRRDTEWL
jgi:cytochrome c-type biogenesis protein CcmH